MKKRKASFFYILFGFLVLIASCRKDSTPIQQEKQQLFPPASSSIIKGMYLLNEGNLNSNKASLDYVDYRTGIYTRNIYNQANPEVTKGLGDAGNDIGIYGSRLYVVVNNSNKVEVMDASSCKRITQINISNCRYICFHNGKAYVSAYIGKVGDPNSPQGIVAEIDTASFQISRQVTVGRQPEEMVVVDEKLYVANSGGYSPPSYERTVSVIDLASLTEIKKIDVAINLDRIKADANGNIYVSSRGDYYNIPSSLYKIDSKRDAIKKDFGIPASNFWIQGNLMYVFSTQFDYLQGKNMINYAMIDINNEAIIPGSFIKDGTEQKIALPYGIAINQETEEMFITDAKDYVTPGTLYCFDKNGIKKWSVLTGDIPGHFAFVY